MSHESLNIAGAERCYPSKATCAAPSCEALSPCRGLRPPHARKDRVGTWETSSGPQSLWRSRAVAGTRGVIRQGTDEESDALVVPTKRPNKAVMSGGGGRGGKGRGRRKRGWSRMLRAQYRNPHALTALPLHGSSTGRHSGPYARSRPTFGRSPVRESRTPGSVRGAASNRRPYRDRRRKRGRLATPLRLYRRHRKAPPRSRATPRSSKSSPQRRAAIFKPIECANYSRPAAIGPCMCKRRNDVECCDQSLVHRFRSSNHIRRRYRACRTKCGRRGLDRAHD